MSLKICGSCGKEIQDDFNLCPYCGKNLEEQESSISMSVPPISGSKKSELKEKIWMFPAIAGILTIIALFCPAAYATEETPFFKVKINTYIWIWGIIYGPKGFMYISKNDFYIFSFTISMIILILACILIWSSRQLGVKKMSIRKIQIVWTLTGLFQIILTLSWILAFEQLLPGIWAIFNFSFGIIGIFVSAIISTFSGIILGQFDIEIPKKEKKDISYDKDVERSRAVIAIVIAIVLLIIFLFIGLSFIATIF